MDRLNRLSDTEAKLYDIVKRICSRRKSGEVYDYEVANEYNRLYADAYHKQETISRLLRNIKYSGRIVGGQVVIKKRGKLVQRTRYGLAPERVAA